MTFQFKHFHKRIGLSLVEMAMALMIFGIVAIPMVSIPMKAADQTEEAKHSSLSAYESTRILKQLVYEVNHSHNFFPLTIDNPQFPVNSMVFIAFREPQANKIVRVGYALREILGAGDVSYSPKRYQLLRTEISPDRSLTEYTINSSLWLNSGHVLQSQDFYLTSDSLDSLRFNYCEGSRCEQSVSPYQATGISIFAGNAIDSAAAKFFIVYKNNKLQVDPLYMKLGSQLKDDLLQEANVLSESMTVEAFGQANTSQQMGWGNLYQSDSWRKIGPMPNTGVNNVLLSSAAMSSTGSLTPQDMFYNSRTNQLWMVASAPSANPTASGRNDLFLMMNPMASLILDRLSVK